MVKHLNKLKRVRILNENSNSCLKISDMEPPKNGELDFDNFLALNNLIKMSEVWKFNYKIFWNV